ncbi:hypothetical protein ACFYYH_08960 [Streptomyces sp. NPDC002018]|uniref:hypothetical protein n=1 Tax=Streptomyces sp. NPDC002018 TaxID=3364629 RepID=UPI003692E345
MSKTVLARLAHRRKIYTGETFEQAHQALAALPYGSSPLPAAGSRAQEEFESDVFLEVHRGADYREFPFGIRSTVPDAHTLRLKVESERQAELMLTFMLPVHGPEEEVGGVCGLRIRNHSRDGIEFHQPGRSCSLWMTGPPETAWRRIEAARLLHVTEIGCKPCWRCPDWTEEELLHKATWGSDSWTARFREGGWLTSGLLRRLPLFHTVAVPQAVSAWHGLGPGTAHWKMELDHLPASSYRVDELLEALTDPVFGLPFAPNPSQRQHRTPEEGGTRVRLQDQSKTGVLEMLFCRFDNQLEKKRPELHAAIATRISAVKGT